MVILDFFFKLYFSFLKSKDEQGAASSAIIVSVPLALNIWLALLFLVSHVFPLREIDSFFFVFPLGILCFCIGIFFRRTYVVMGRYKAIKFETIFLYYLMGIAHWFFSIIYFIYEVNKLYNG